jgi:preprotein translocase SecE subunit
VARDRQRAKQRRRQRQTGAPRRDRSTPTDTPLPGGDDDATVDSILGQGTAAPDPLKNATPDADQAQLAEAGAQRGLSGDVDDEVSSFRDESDDAPAAVRYDPAPDEVEGDRRVPREELDEAVAEDIAPKPARSRGRVLAFLGHSADELRRVIWPDRRQVGQATAVVLGFVVLAGGYLGLMDALWKPLVNAIL